MTALRRLCLATLAVSTVAGAPLAETLVAQGWPPDSTVNLQVLPEDISIPDLIETMKGFAGALGVRCTHCHVGDDPSDLSTIDFPADDKIEKRKAREMIKMRDRINGELLATVPERSDPPVEVRCATCHHALPKPADLRDVLAEAVAEGGADLAIVEYDRLREEYYGSWSYDFGEMTLTSVAERTAGEHPDDALALLDHNLHYFPESAVTYITRAQILASVKGDFDGAIASIREAQRVMPGVPRFAQMIEQLEAARARAADAQGSGGSSSTGDP